MHGGCHTQTKKHTEESRQIPKECLVVVVVVVVVVVLRCLSVDRWYRALRMVRSGKAVPQGEPAIQAWKDNLWLHAERLSQISISCLCGDAPFVPCDWTRVQIAWLPKPGKAPCAPKSLRTIGLMPADSKAFLLVLREQIRETILQSLYEVPQYAYRPHMDTNDAILRATYHCNAIRGLLQSTVRNNTARLMGASTPELCGGLLVSLDLAKAFDSVPHQELYFSLLDCGVEYSVAQVLMQVHIQTQCEIVHSKHGRCVGMSRGLRQGCPVAPIMYAAWTRRFSLQLNAAFGEFWSHRHLSIFADDTLVFWPVSSRLALVRAIKEAGTLMQILSFDGMTINYEKSSCLLALAGTRKKQALQAYTEWHQSKECLRLRVGSSQVRIPIVEQLTYLGVQLSYGKFGAQTVQYRVEKANKQFQSLTSVLRSTSKFSKANRLRIYKACVWSSLRYGLLATGINQAGYNQVVTTLCIHLRKVLRVFEHGISNQQVLQQAELDPLAFFRDQAEQLRARIMQDSARSPAVVEPEQQQIQDNHKVVHAICDLQPHLPLLEVDQLHGSFECGRCGLLFATEEGRTMHVKHKHPDLHCQAGIPFSRRAHSLFGLSMCRLCRVHLHDWGSLRKHIASGTCQVLKEAAACGQTIGAVMDMVAEQERLHPPIPPAPLAEVRHVEAHEPWMSSPLPEALADEHLHRRLGQACALCGQRLIGMAKVKSHWQATHPKAWKLAQHRAMGEMQSLKATFTVPCRYCGSHARSSSQHSKQCHVLFQLCAIREVFRAKQIDAVLSESTQVIRRQDKYNPEYLRCEPANTPIGKALRAAIAEPDTCSKAPHAAMAPSRPTETAALRLATTSTRATTAPSGDAMAWTLSAVLSNPNVLCYVNSSMLALLHVGEVTGMQDPNLDRLRHELLQMSASNSSPLLSSLRSFGSIARGWRFNGRQEDAAEFTLHVLTALGLRGLWQSRVDDEGGVRVTDRGTMLYFQLPSVSCTLQDLVEAWTFQQHVYALSGEWDRVPVVLGRYARGRKNQARVIFDGDLQLPVFGHGSDLRQARYRVAAALVHLGDEPNHGHYRALLRYRNRWYYTDDGIASCETQLQGVHACNVYLLWLVKQGL